MIKHRYYEDLYIEVELIDNDEDIRSMSLYHLDKYGKVQLDKGFHIVIDWNTPKHLLDLAIEVSEDGYE